MLTELTCAFSRDQRHKVYVQDRLREQAARVWDWLQDGTHFYICGDASRMAKDVEAALTDIISSQGAMSDEDAAAYLKAMAKAAGATSETSIQAPLTQPPATCEPRLNQP